MRILAMRTGREVRVLDMPSEANEASDILLFGAAIMSGGAGFQGRIIPVVPSIRNFPVEWIFILLLPEIDEDGRRAFWLDRSQNSEGKLPQIITLAGVGTRVEWAWDQAIEALRALDLTVGAVISGTVRAANVLAITRTAQAPQPSGDPCPMLANCPRAPGQKR